MSNTKEFFTAFRKYIDEHNRLDVEYNLIRGWHPIKRFRNIKKRENLTKIWLAKTRKFGLFDKDK